MNWLKKMKLFTVIMFVCSVMLSGTLTSCKKGEAAGDGEATEHPAADSTENAENEHPAGDSEHPNSDSTGTN